MRILFGTAQVGLGLLMVWLSKRFIDETIHTGSKDDIVQMIILLALTVLGRILLRQVYFYMTTVASTCKSNELRLSLFSKLFSRRLFDENELHSGDITSRLSKDIDSVSGVIAETVPQMVVTGIQLLGAFLLMRFFDAWLAWALVIFTPLAIILGKFVARKLKRMTLDIREKESQIQMHVQEGVEYNAVLRSLGSEQWVADRLDSMQQELRGNVLRRTRFSVITRFMLGIAFGFGYLAAFIWGGLGL
jgi:ABC-type multidrug transport system fused ATPase/permease subunit